MHNLPTWLTKYKESLSKEKLHHAYLLYGREGLGKENLITSIGNAILCESSNLVVCNQCKNCTLISSNNHPDFHSIQLEEGKKNISISQILNLRNTIYESSFLGKKAYILESLY